MPRPLTLEYARQLEARARDIRASEKRKARATDTRAKVLLGALALSFASGGPAGLRVLEAFARLPSLSERDRVWLASHLPEPYAAPFAAPAPKESN